MINLCSVCVVFAIILLSSEKWSLHVSATDVFLVMGFTGVASKAAHECGCHLRHCLQSLKSE